jgi:hypothetical protein
MALGLTQPLTEITKVKVKLNKPEQAPRALRITRWVGHMARMAGRGVHRVLVGKPEGKKSLGRPKRRWDYNIKMDIQELGGGCADWMELA